MRESLHKDTYWNKFKTYITKFDKNYLARWFIRSDAQIFQSGQFSSKEFVQKNVDLTNSNCYSEFSEVGTDEKGEFFLRNMRKLGIDTYMQNGKLPTGQAICFITPASLRIN